MLRISHRNSYPVYDPKVKPQLSLSDDADIAPPIGWQVKGEDVALEHGAPLREDLDQAADEGAVLTGDDILPPAENAIAPEVAASETEAAAGELLPEDVPIRDDLSIRGEQEKGYQTSRINQAILTLVNRVKQGLSAKNERVQLGTVSDNIADQIQKLTGVDAHGYKVAVEARQIEHILKDHGENGQSDRSMANADDIAKMEFALENPDSVVNAGTTKAYVTNKNGKMKPAQTVLYEKQNGDDSYYVVQAVPDTNKKTLYIVTAFIGKSGYKNTEAPQSTNANSPGATPEAESAVASNNIISTNGGVVNDDIGPVRDDLGSVAGEMEDIGPVRDDLPIREDIGESDGKQRKWIGTSTESNAVDGKILPDDLDQELIHYQPVSNKKTLGNANAKLDSMGYETAVGYLSGQFASSKVTLDDIALGERLIQEAAKRGDTKTAGDLIMDISILGTELGQKVQALSIIKRLTPEGQLKMLQRVVERGKIKGDQAFEGVEITQEMIDYILKTYGKDGTYDQTELNKRVEDVKQQIADQMKVSAMDYVNEWRYLSMLGNPKTHIRNMVSNAAMWVTRQVKNAIARTIEDIAPVKERTKTWKLASRDVKACSTPRRRCKFI